MAQNTHVAEQLVAAAMDLAAKKGWRSLSLAEIAEAAGVPLVDAYSECPTRMAILKEAFAETDRKVLVGPRPDREEPARDRLFDVMMRRFDAMAPRKQGVAAILRDLPGDPGALMCSLPHLAKSMAWMLEAAGLSASGPVGTLRIKALSAVYLATLRDWLNDDSPDLARTMAGLDRRLRRVESVMPGWRVSMAGLCGARPSRRSTDESPPESVVPVET